MVVNVCSVAVILIKIEKIAERDFLMLRPWSLVGDKSCNSSHPLGI